MYDDSRVNPSNHFFLMWLLILWFYLIDLIHHSSHTVFSVLALPRGQALAAHPPVPFPHSPPKAPANGGLDPPQTTSSPLPSMTQTAGTSVNKSSSTPQFYETFFFFFSCPLRGGELHPPVYPASPAGDCHLPDGRFRGSWRGCAGRRPLEISNSSSASFGQQVGQAVTTNIGRAVKHEQTMPPAALFTWCYICDVSPTNVRYCRFWTTIPTTAFRSVWGKNSLLQLLLVVEMSFNQASALSKS